MLSDFEGGKKKSVLHSKGSLNLEKKKKRRK